MGLEWEKQDFGRFFCSWLIFNNFTTFLVLLSTLSSLLSAFCLFPTSSCLHWMQQQTLWNLIFSTVWNKALFNIFITSREECKNSLESLPPPSECIDFISKAPLLHDNAALKLIGMLRRCKTFHNYFSWLIRVNDRWHEITRPWWDNKLFTILILRLVFYLLMLVFYLLRLVFYLLGANILYFEAGILFLRLVFYLFGQTSYHLRLASYFLRQTSYILRPLIFWGWYFIFWS